MKENDLAHGEFGKWLEKGQMWNESYNFLSSIDRTNIKTDKGIAEKEGSKIVF